MGGVTVFVIQNHFIIEGEPGNIVGGDNHLGIQLRKAKRARSVVGRKASPPELVLFRHALKRRKKTGGGKNTVGVMSWEYFIIPFEGSKDTFSLCRDMFLGA